MDKKLEKGTEVLIFNYIREWGQNQDELHFIKGNIIESNPIDLSVHGSAYDKKLYTILGEDGNIYKGTYGYGIVGNCFIRTVEDHKLCLIRNIDLNNRRIEKLKKENTMSFRLLDELEKMNNKCLVKKNKMTLK